MLVFFHLWLIFVLCFVMYKASEWLIQSIKTLADDGFLGKFFLASIFAGAFSALPELFIGITSAVQKTPNVAFGNSIGSTISNLGLIFAVATLFSPYKVQVHKEAFTLRSVLILMTSSLFPFFLALDGKLSRIDGLFLILLFLTYSLYLFNKRIEPQEGLRNFFLRLEKTFSKKEVRSSIGLLLGSIIVLLVASHFLLGSALFLAQALSVRPFLIAVFILAPGTSFPELFVSLNSVRKREFNVLYGDIFGSLIANANLIIGVSSFIYPYKLEVFPEYLIALLGLVIIFALFIVFSSTKRRFDKWEAAVLLFFYLLFFFLETFLRK